MIVFLKSIKRGKNSTKWSASILNRCLLHNETNYKKIYCNWNIVVLADMLFNSTWLVLTSKRSHDHSKPIERKKANNFDQLKAGLNIFLFYELQIQNYLKNHYVNLSCITIYFDHICFIHVGKIVAYACQFTITKALQIKEKKKELNFFFSETSKTNTKITKTKNIWKWS